MAKRDSKHKTGQKNGKLRDLNTCQICGSTDCPQGHHIIDFQFGGSADQDNIITLCDDHHKKVHNNKIDISKF